MKRTEKTQQALPDVATEPGRSRRCRPATFRQRGIALLMCLGILSLILILAMSFSFTARTDRLAATVDADITRARLLVESALERAMAFISYEFNYSSGPHSGSSVCLYPATSGSLFAAIPASAATTNPWYYDEYSTSVASDRYYAVSTMILADQDDADIETALAARLYYGTTNFDFTPTASTQESGDALHSRQSWHHITNSNGDLIGRIAFLMIDESGKIDPNGVLTVGHEPYYDADSNGSWSAGEHFFDLDGNSSFTNTSMYEGSVSRSVGGSAQEMYLGYLFYSFPTAVTDTLTTDVLATAGLRDFLDHMPTRGQHWFSWRHLCRSGIDGLSATAIDGRTVAEESTVRLFPHSYDIEAFQDAGGTARHRFALDPSWTWDDTSFWEDSAEVIGLGTAADAFWSSGVGSSATTPTAFADETSGSGIPWLSNMVDESGASITAQVCANIIDYCDSDDAATTDLDLTAIPPTVSYLGLEKMPYVNEVAVAAVFIEDSPAAGEAELAVTVDVELINIYDAASTVDVEVWVDYRVQEMTPPEQAFHSSRTSIAVPANGYGAVEFPSNGMSTIVTWTISGQARARMTVTGARVVVRDSASASVVDYASIEKASNRLQIRDLDTGYYSTEVYDSRNNTDDSNWDNWDEQANNMGVCSLTFSPGVGVDPVPNGNSISDPSSPSSQLGNVDYDDETVTDPASGMSTAYIRNAPMESLWELGAIHRGEPWRTINLKAYNDGASAREYSNGDAMLLDQVKIGPYTEVTGKVNANSPSQHVWRTVLGGVRLGATYANATSAGGGIISGADIDIMITASGGTDGIFKSNGATGDLPFFRRSELAAVETLSDGTAGTQTTDRAQEEIIAKIVNLLTVRQNYFTIIATGQAVKDLQADMSGIAVSDRPANWVQFGSGATDWCAVLGEQKAMAIIYRDAYENHFRVERFEYLEQD